MKSHRALRNTYALIALVVILSLCAAVAIILSSTSTPSSAPSPTTSETPKADVPVGLGDIGPQPTPTSYVSNLGGFITEVGSNTLTISNTPPNQKAPILTKVTVGPDTSIFKEIPKDQAAYKKEQDAYIARHDYSHAPPLPYTTQSLTLSDLKADMLVNIKLAEPTSEGATAHALEIGVLPIQPKYPTPSASQ